MSNITPFNFDGKSVRVEVDDTRQPWFNANDVCEALEMGNPWQAVKTHVDPEDLQKMEALTAGGRQAQNYVNESGLYALIFGSTKPEAKKFKKWVTSEVLPTIRKTGTYTAKKQPDPLKLTTEAARALPALIRAGRLLGLDKNAAAIAANQAIYGMTNVNLMQQLGHTHLVAENQDSGWYTPTELGGIMGTSARGVNLLLAEAGLQVKIGEKWEATEVGREFSRLFDTGKRHASGVPVTQMKWSKNVLPMLGESKEAA